MNTIKVIAAVGSQKDCFILDDSIVCQYVINIRSRESIFQELKDAVSILAIGALDLANKEKPDAEWLNLRIAGSYNGVELAGTNKSINIKSTSPMQFAKLLIDFCEEINGKV